MTLPVSRALTRHKRDELVDAVRGAQKRLTELSDQMEAARKEVRACTNPEIQRRGFLLVAKDHIDSTYQLLEYAIVNVNEAVE